MKINKLCTIISFYLAVYGGVIVAMEPSQQSSQSWYDWAASGVNTTILYGKALYEQLPTIRPQISTSEQKSIPQEKQAQEKKDTVEIKQQPESKSHKVTNSKNFVVQQCDQFTIVTTKTYGVIYEGNNPKYRIEKLDYGCVKPGVYCFIKDELESISLLRSKNNEEMVKNQLGYLHFSDEALRKMKENDYHNFPTCLEKNFGEWARVVIERPICSVNNLQKIFTLKITIPGSINGRKGVFEFIVEKNLYQEHGECTHRFFRPNGICGGKQFGKQEKIKIETMNK